jgi:hypothetical protein
MFVRGENVQRRVRHTGLSGPRSTKRFFWLSLLLMPLLLPCHALQGASLFPIANSTDVEFAGGAVSDGTNYFVGFVDGTNIVGQKVTSSGQLTGSQITIGANPGFPPNAALAGARTNALVAWSDYSISSGVNIFGQLVSPSAGKIGSKFALLASAGSHGTQQLQALASDGTNYLAVWMDASSSLVYGQRISGGGVLQGSEFQLFTPSGSEGNRNLALAFGATNYLLVWQSGNNNSNTTYAAAISLSGSVGSATPISSTPSLDNNPVAVASDGTNFLAVWNCDTSVATNGTPNWNLYGRIVASTAAPLGTELALVTEHAAFPALVFDGDNFLLAWGYNTDTTNSDTTIHTRFFTRSGAAAGPMLAPFPTQGTNPALLPLNGLCFNGSKLFAVVTCGRFQVNASGDVTGFSGGDVYATLANRSGTPPAFTNAMLTNGQFCGQLQVVKGVYYTLLTSTNLKDWSTVDLVSSSTNSLITLHDSRGVAYADRMFYRAQMGNHLGLLSDFWFLEFINAGSFGSGTTATVSYPVSLAYYSAALGIENDSAPPAATNVFFTGPSGSGLSHAAASTNNSSIADGFYQSPYVTNPAAGPGGVWTVSYHGTNLTFNVADSQAASRMVVPVPTANVVSGVLQSITWTYKDAATGAPLSGPPSWMTKVFVEVNGYVGGRLLNSPTISPATTSYTLDAVVQWSNVCTIDVNYNDTLGNHYVLFFTKP